MFLSCPALADDDSSSDDDRSSRENPYPNQCSQKKLRNGMTLKCLEALFRNDEFNRIFESLPGVQDGRMNKADLIGHVARASIVPEARLPARLDPNEDDSDDHVEDDGRTPVYLSRAEIAELKRGDGFPVQSIVLDPDQGPTDLQNFPTLPPPDPFPLPQPGFSPPPPNPYELDVGDFLSEVHAMLSPNVNGYALKIRYQGQTVGILQWNWARNPFNSDFPAVAWNTDRRMHVASISKFMTAIGLIHMFENPQMPILDAEDYMWTYLPEYWDRGAGSNEWIKYRHLLDHRSGFSTGGSSSNWQTMKSNVENGVSFGDIGDADYENMNFGLIRILMATIGGYIDTDTNWGFEWMNDLMWDILTWVAYDDYMQTYVFNPVGAFPEIDKNLFTTLAYRFNGTGPGWNTGNFSGSAGGVGWHMTISEILDVTRAFRKAQIVSLGGVSDILLGSWGLNSSIGGNSTDAGLTYFKAGRWTDNGDDSVARTEQCFVFMMPKEMEVVVFVNSPVSANGTSLTNIIRTAFNNSIFIP